jgi:hypothetical protein
MPSVVAMSRATWRLRGAPHPVVDLAQQQHVRARQVRVVAQRGDQRIEVRAALDVPRGDADLPAERLRAGRILELDAIEHAVDLAADLRPQVAALELLSGLDRPERLEVAREVVRELGHGWSIAESSANAPSAAMPWSAPQISRCPRLPRCLSESGPEARTRG